MCKTCRLYPRHIEEFEGVREISLSVSCPDVARILQNQSEKVRFLSKENEKEEEYEDFDPFLYSALLDARDVMFELLQNLLSNAVNYNKDGGTVETVLEETASATMIRVKDTGIGIAKENIPHLCERFYRVDKSRSKKTGGTGLGLAIVKHICALYGAEISINSEIDVGTEVVIVFKKDKK